MVLTVIEYEFKEVVYGMVVYGIFLMNRKLYKETCINCICCQKMDRMVLNKGDEEGRSQCEQTL